jgi:CRISPR-associated protein Cas2
MLEIGPGVYTAPRMTKAVRERVWAVMEDWFAELGGGSIVMTWRDPSLPGGQRVAVLGSPACELHRHNGVYLVKRRAASGEP